MIWLTGDKHGQIEAFETNSQYKKLSKKDTLIICGDFGFVWDGGKQERRNLKWLAKRKFNIAFVDGWHENFDLLTDYPVEDWNGGKVRRLAPNLVWMLRGESYELEGKKVLAFGGGSCDNQSYDAEPPWRSKALPTEEQVDNVIAHIRQASGSFDLIVSHEPPRSIKSCLDDAPGEFHSIHDILEQVRTHTTFSQWFFGRYHIDKPIPPNYYAVFNRVVSLSPKK